MKKIIATILILLVSSPVWAGSGTVNYNSSGSSPFRTTTDGSSKNLGNVTIWDFTAGANGAAVDTNNSLHVDAPTSSQLHSDLIAPVPAQIATPPNMIGAISFDVCSYNLKQNFSISTAVGNTQIVGGVGGKKVYICSILMFASGGASVSIIEGTGAACTTSNEASVIGSTTAANGLPIPANGGLTYGNGAGTVGVTATAANGICILQSGTTPLSGNITYVQQ